MSYNTIVTVIVNSKIIYKTLLTSTVQVILIERRSPMTKPQSMAPSNCGLRGLAMCLVSAQ